jgi:curved DNA-binding protein CbpA
MAFKNYYDILGLTHSATQEEVKSAYRKLSMKFHPDKNNGDDFLAEMFKNINEANEILSNPTKRKEYDNTLKSFEDIGNNSNYNPTNYPESTAILDVLKSINEYFRLEKIANQKYLAKTNAEYIPKPQHFTFAKVLLSILILLFLWVFVRPQYTVDSNITANNSTKWTTTQSATLFSEPNINSTPLTKVSEGTSLTALKETNYFIQVEIYGKDSIQLQGYIRKKQIKHNE